MSFNWIFLIDLGFISIALFLATLLRRRVHFFQKYLIPNSLTAGFILLLFYNGGQMTGLWLTDSLENLIFHCLNISFIAMILRKGEKQKSKKRSVMAMTTSLLLQYAIQCFFGTLITLILIKTLLPSLFPGFGLFAPLGFSLGPGQAFAIASGWEILGFKDLGSIGITFGAIGFLLSCFGGIILINQGVKRGWVSLKVPSAEVLAHEDRENSQIISNKLGDEAIDPLSLSSALVLGTYLLSYGFLKGLSFLLAFLGPLGVEFGTNLWGIMFIFSALTAMVVKKVILTFKGDFLLDDERLTRLSGLAVDYMVAASIGAISIVALRGYWIPILLITCIVGFLTIFSHIWISSRLFSEEKFYKMILVFGCATGTLSTGLALLRIIDPEFKTSASKDYMYASGFVFLLIIPIILTANMPCYGALKGTLTQTYMVFILYALYLVGCLIAYLFLSQGRGLKRVSQLWYYKKS